ncbi:unnamed protein product [Choristocarpus tenellus]
MMDRLEWEIEGVKGALSGKRGYLGMTDQRMLVQELTELREAYSYCHKEKVLWISRLPQVGSAHSDELQYLEGSVYLWACQPLCTKNEASVPAEDVALGWVVLVWQLVVYGTVIWVAADSDPEQNTSENESSLMSVTVTMFLMLSIASPDLVAGCHLLYHPGRMPCRRRFFGVLLVLSFAMLAAASLSLFYDLEGVDLILGAAAVLFVAEVDEKAMKALMYVPESWRLFCVLETIALSFALGVTFAILTEKNISDKDDICVNIQCLFFTIASIPFHIMGVTMAASAVYGLLSFCVHACRVGKECIPPHQVGSTCIIIVWIVVWWIDVLGSFAGLYDDMIRSNGFLFIGTAYNYTLFSFAQFALIVGFALHTTAYFVGWPDRPHAPATLLGAGLAQWVSYIIIKILMSLPESQGYILYIVFCSLVVLGIVVTVVFRTLRSSMWHLSEGWDTKRQWKRIGFWTVVAMYGHILYYYAILFGVRYEEL